MTKICYDPNAGQPLPRLEITDRVLWYDHMAPSQYLRLLSREMESKIANHFREQVANDLQQARTFTELGERVAKYLTVDVRSPFGLTPFSEVAPSLDKADEGTVGGVARIFAEALANQERKYRG